jgi:Ca-activated chloride channel family protein
MMKTAEIRLTMETDLDLVARDRTTERVIELVVTAPEAPKRRSRPPLNLALVLDRSGSMSGEKLEYVKQAALFVIEQLEKDDQVALVVYDDVVDLLCSSVHVTPTNREIMKQKIHQVFSGRTTNLSGGWLAGCEQVAAASTNGSLNRSLLLTDGLANAGIVDLEMLAKHAYELAHRGVSTSTFGVGLDFNHHLLETMANQGGGAYYYIERPRDIPGIFAREFQELIATTLLDVELSITLPSGAIPKVLGGWRSLASADQLRIELGAMYSGREERIYVKVQLPPVDGLEAYPVQAALRGKLASGILAEAEAGTVFRSATDAEIEAAEPNSDLLRRYAQVEMAELVKESLKLEQMGRCNDASNMMNQAIQCHQDHLSASQKEEYEQIAKRLEHGLMDGERKAYHQVAYFSSRNRLY